MTKEKAIELLDNLIGMIEDNHGADYDTALHMAIKALEQEPTTRNCFGCKYSKDNHNAGTEECHLCMWENQYTPTTKNNLGVDAISRKQAIEEADKLCLETGYDNEKVIEMLNELPPVTPQEPKPMVEIDLDYVIRQKYIEREVLDKLRAEIDKARFVDKDTRICKNALASGLDVALQIIDKYKAESEDK